MKKILILVSLFFFVACSSDDDNTAEEISLEERLFGTWQYKTIIINGVEVELEEGHCLLDNKITYKPNNEITYNAVSYVSEECIYLDADEFWIVQDEMSYLSVDPGDDVGVIFTVEFMNDDEFFLYRNLGDDLLVVRLERL